MSFFTWSRAALAGAVALGALSVAPALADEQFFPLQSYREGPYAAGGSGFFGGFIDYLNLINIRDGGVNGVKLAWAEGETHYEVERSVEDYERLKTHPAVAAWNPLSAYAMIDSIAQDKTPLITINHGRTDSTDGRVFPYVFPLLLKERGPPGVVAVVAHEAGELDHVHRKDLRGGVGCSERMTSAIARP